MWSNELREFFFRGIKGMNFDASNNIIDSFNIYSDLLKEWNEKINLTAITEDEDIILKHFLDSISILPWLTKDEGSLIDVGTGAGFPGIPVKMMKNNLKVVLLDSLDKRIKFLEEVVNNLGLKDISAIHARAEDAGRDPSLREKFDYCTARAVAKLPVLSEYCLPFVKTGGFFIAMKGNDIEEIRESDKALKVLGGEITEVKNIILPQSNIERNIIVIKKVRQISTAYPRKSGKPSKNPII